MAIQIAVDRVEQNTLREKVAFVVLRNNSPSIAFRRAAVYMPLQADAEDYISQNHTAAGLWAQGTGASEKDWVKTQEEPLSAPIYRPIIRNVFPFLIANDLDAARSAALGLIGQSDDLQADFVSIRNNLGLTGTDEATKREQLLWIIVLALVGEVNSKS